MIFQAAMDVVLVCLYPINVYSYIYSSAVKRLLYYIFKELLIKIQAFN